MGKYDQELIETAQKLSTPGKGILAADESTGTIGKRFAPISVENNQDNRRRYRQLLFETPDLNKYISGVITFEETLFEKKTDGTPFVDLLNEQNIVIGIKVDKGQKPLTEYGETATQGIDGLGDRCAEYYKAGARFAKWRAVLKIDDKNCPSQLCIDEQTRGLARYAQICQENGLVPIVEPEILMDGDHTLEKSAQVFERVWYSQIKHLSEYGVLFEGILLKPNFVRCGVECSTQSSMEEIASYTLRSLQRTIPSAIPGINFLSGGMSETQATETLNILNSIAGKKPWSLSFSYGRALQATVLQQWKGEDSNIEAAQAALMVRAKANGMAQLGKYAGEEGDGEASKSLHQKNYTY